MDLESENDKYPIEKIKTRPCYYAGVAVNHVAEAIAEAEKAAIEAGLPLVMCGSCEANAMLAMVQAAKKMVESVQSNITTMAREERISISREKAEKNREKRSLFNSSGTQKMTPRNAGLSLPRKKRPTKRKNTKKRRTKRRR